MCNGTLRFFVYFAAISFMAFIMCKKSEKCKFTPAEANTRTHSDKAKFPWKKGEECKQIGVNKFAQSWCSKLYKRKYINKGTNKNKNKNDYGNNNNNNNFTCKYYHEQHSATVCVWVAGVCMSTRILEMQVRIHIWYVYI